MLYPVSLFALFLAAQAARLSRGDNRTTVLCKVNPHDILWPTAAEWACLNATVDGKLIKTVPVAYSCLPGNPLHSVTDCAIVEENWGLSSFHASLPESIDFPGFAKDSCLPPNAAGYIAGKPCQIGGMPQYVVNATTEAHVATALRWAVKRNIRVVVKGTGHELNGRSSGAYSLSIWTHNFNELWHETSWPIPGSNTTADVLVTGSGNNWGQALRFALSRGRVTVSGVDETVGLGGYIQGGGHGPLSSTYCLAADQVLQFRVVTASGKILVANAVQNQDLFWALRGGGGGQYGVVTEYALWTYPQPEQIVTTSIYIAAVNISSTEPLMVDATWEALVLLFAKIPDLMDPGVTGSGLAAWGATAQGVLGLEAPSPGAALSLNVWPYNKTEEQFMSLLRPVRSAILAALNGTNGAVNVSIPDPTIVSSFSAFFDSLNSSPRASGSIGLSSSRLLDRAALSDLPSSQLSSYLQRIAVSEVEGAGAMLVIGLQGGPGPRNVPNDRRGAVNPV